MSTEIRRLLLAEFDRAIDGDHDQIARWVRSRESELRELLGIDVRAEVRGLLDGWREAAETLKAADSTTDVARGLQLRVCVKQLEAALLAAPAVPLTAYWMKDGKMYPTTVEDWLAKTESFHVQSSFAAWVICEARRLIDALMTGAAPAVPVPWPEACPRCGASTIYRQAYVECATCHVATTLDWVARQAEGPK